VTITKGFWLGQTPVTQEAYERASSEATRAISKALGCRWTV
jgi:hypothetical protein